MTRGNIYAVNYNLRLYLVLRVSCYSCSVNISSGSGFEFDIYTYRTC